MAKKRVFRTGPGAATLNPAFSPRARHNRLHPPPSPLVPAEQRANEALSVRITAAQQERALPLPNNQPNGDAALGNVGLYGKALPHGTDGLPNSAALTSLLQALQNSVSSVQIESLPLGGTTKFIDPQAADDFDLIGVDSHHTQLPAPPAFSSPEMASEMAEDYWHALCRDVAFDNYGADSTVAAAATNLTAFSTFSGPKVGGVVTPGSLFRGTAPGALIGPYISQFLYLDMPFGATKVVQAYKVPTSVPGNNFMTTRTSWLSIQNGVAPAGPITYDPTPFHIRNGRDMGEYVQQDFSYQAFLTAALILLSFGPTALDANNPYLGYTRQAAFSGFGGPFILNLVAKVADSALRAAWYHKWLVDMRLRPEAYGGRVNDQMAGTATYPLPAELIGAPGSTVLAAIHAATGAWLLPQAYPPGSPTHPSYPAGHAAIAGACVTVLKAFFKESKIIPSPVFVDAAGVVHPYSGPDTLTIQSELNKLAYNISLGRDFAGVHYRSDGVEGMNLGQQVALAYLRDQKLTYHEVFTGFTVTLFDGTTIVI